MNRNSIIGVIAVWVVMTLATSAAHAGSSATPQAARAKSFSAASTMRARALAVASAARTSSSSTAATESAGAFSIHPDYHLTPNWVKAGAYFTYNGARVKADNVHIHTMLPKVRQGNDFIYGVRDHNESNVGEPDWSGHWDEPWRIGFFYYTVTAIYRGQSYQRTFVVGRNKYFVAATTAAEIAKAIAAAYNGGKN